MISCLPYIQLFRAYYIYTGTLPTSTCITVREPDNLVKEQYPTHILHTVLRITVRGNPSEYRT
jgi:hypothetical protein